jgi:hypothetical protein
MDYFFVEIKELPEMENFDAFFSDLNSENCVFNVLIINDKKYCFEGYSNDHYLEKANIVLVNMWNKIVMFSINDGNLLYYSGLNDSFVGVEELKMDFLITTDSTLFLINKTYFYPWGFKIFTDHIQDYEIDKDSYNITLKFALEDDITIKLNSI